ncbi:hypothetical protein GCM10008983_18020 [Lentibacillus halophilus]|uniref:SCP domain-containing protein n=1 Tax=Lentibacillus halophilus TaxID=295065 RepID=A0ABP3J477_9BACI
MRNKLMTGTLTIALLFGGAFQMTADVSANSADVPKQNNQEIVYSTIEDDGWSELSSSNFQDVIKQYFPQANFDSNNQQDTNENDQEQKKQDPNKQTNQPAEQQPTEQQQKQHQQNASQSQQLSEFEQQVVELTNQERTSQGLDPLKVDTELSKVARKKSQDMADNGYFAHNSPNYGSPFDMMEQFGISYQTAGENIAKGQSTPQQVVDGWMNSEGHRENIMNPDFTHIGVGYVEQGNHWTQQFIGK